jgi:hypothetical protein
LILGAIGPCVEQEFDDIKQRIVNFLLAQRSQQWTFNYWQKESLEYEQLPYPDDLDDTFCALSSMYKFDPGLITGEALAAAINVLTAQEVKPGGPYRTWLVGEDSDDVWRDVDLAVNSNIALFLSQQKVELPELIAFQEHNIQQENFRSPYYPSFYPIVYFLSRCYRGNLGYKISGHILRHQNIQGYWQNPLDTALAVTSLLNLNFPPEQLKSAIQYLLESQDNGSWFTSPFCFDPNIEEQKYVAGSESLTTAFCCEALCLYQKAIKASQDRPQASLTEDEVYQQTVELVKHRFESLESELRETALSVLQKTMSNDPKRMISLLSLNFDRSLGKEAERKWLLKLGAANIYGWIAYTIYDDVLDNTPNPLLLSVANLCLREVTTVYGDFSQQYPGFNALFEQVMDGIDSANIWEIKHARTEVNRELIKLSALPDYGDYKLLAQRSFGHALGPVALLFIHKLNSAKQIDAVQQYFTHYLIARQLNDDAHDWLEDLQQGQLNSVGVLVLQQWLTGRSLPQDITLDLLPQLQQFFWDNVIDAVVNLIDSHIAAARQEYRNMDFLIDTDYLDSLLLPLAEAAKQAKRGVVTAREFLTAYSSGK